MREDVQHITVDNQIVEHDAINVKVGAVGINNDVNEEVRDDFKEIKSDVKQVQCNIKELNYDIMEVKDDVKKVNSIQCFLS